VSEGAKSGEEGGYGKDVHPNVVVASPSSHLLTVSVLCSMSLVLEPKASGTNLNVTS